MLRALLKGQIDKMERTWGYDAAYMRRVLNASPMSFLKFGLVSQMVDRKAAPAEALAASGIAGTLIEDCGPCTQISPTSCGWHRPGRSRAIRAGWMRLNKTCAAGSSSVRH